MQPSYHQTLVLESFGLSIIGFMVIVAFHLMGLHVAISFFREKFPIRDISKLRYHQSMFLILAAMMLLFTLHMLTNFAWGLFIYTTGAIPAFREGVYYSLENYTSLGLTRVDVDDRWRMLAPMIAMSGVFCLGWSTAVLVSFFGRLYSIQLDD